MANSTINIESDDELIKALNAHSEAMNNYKERVQGDTEFTNRYKAAPPNADTKPDFASSFYESSTQRNLDNQAKRANIKYVPEFLKYSKDFHQFTSAIASGATSPGGMMRLLNMGGGIAGSAANTTVSAGVAFAANAQDYRNRSAQAAAYGLTPYQQAGFGNQFKDVLGENGAPALFGELVRQQTTLGQPSLFKGWMGQYGQKTTGQESQEDLAEKFLKAQETFAKTVDPSLWKTLSENMGVGLDMGNLMRLREAKPGELDKDIAEERKAGKGYLDDKRAQDLKDLGRESETTTQRMVKNWDWITSEVAPWLTDFLKHLGDLSGKQGGVSKNLGESTIKELVIPFVKLNEEVDKWWEDLKGIFTPGPAHAGEVPSNLPSKNATKQAFEIPGMGGFAIPGSEKVPSNIQDIRDAIINDKGVLRALTDSDINVGGDTVPGSNMTGAPSGYGAAGQVAPIYHSGGIGAAGEPTEITRGGGAVGGVARPAKGALKANQKAAYDAAIAEGLSDSSARAVVANMSGESLANPADVHADPSRSNPNQKAHGIVSWDDQRSARIMKQFGKMPNEMSVADQVKAFAWEAKNYYPNTWKALQGEGSTESKVGTLVSDFERPGNVGQATSQRLGFLKGLPSNFGGGEGGGGGSAISSGAYLVGRAKRASGGASGSWDAGAKVDSDFFKSRASSEVSQTEGLNPEFADDLERATKAGEAATGQKASFTSLVRSKEKQAQLYYNYIHGIGGQGLAAKPGTSLHERGMAADLAEGSTRDWVRAHAADYGMELVPGDPEHVQLAKSRQAIAGAEAAKAASNKDVIAKTDAPRRPEHPSSRNEGQVSQYGKSPTPHLNDMSQFQGDPLIKVHVSNPAGANIVTQVASLGVAQGNFQS